MKYLLNGKSYRLVLCLLCTIFFQQHLPAQTKSFIVPYQDKRFTFDNKEAAAKKWFELYRPKEQESWYEYKGCKLSESGTSVDVITQRFSINRAGEGGADKPETVKGDPTTEATSIEVETLEDKVKAAEEPVAAVVKESVGSPAKAAAAKAKEKPTLATKKNPDAPLESVKVIRTTTKPSRKPDELATARGRSDLELGGQGDISPEKQRDLENERPVADALAKAGYDVEFTEGNLTAAERAREGIRATANPDLRVEGKIWDIYSPDRHSNAVKAIEHAFDKVRDPAGAQTRRVIVSLDAAFITRTQFQAAIEARIKKYGDSGMQEIFAVQKGKIYRMYPF